MASTEEFMMRSCIAIDRRLAAGWENPSTEGLEALKLWQVELLLDWVEENVLHADHVSRDVTSYHLAKIITKRIGDELRIVGGVTNLMAKTALALCGFEPEVAGLGHCHYRFMLREGVRR